MIPTANKLTCKEVVELLTEYLEQALLPETQAAFEEHVEGCPGCTIYVEQVRQTIRMLHQLTEEPTFPENKKELLQVFRGWKKE